MIRLFRILSVFITATIIISSIGFCVSAEADGDIVLGVNAINTTGQEGHSLVLTRAKGLTIGTADGSYTWWRTATFEYSDDADAYIVTAISLFASGSSPKNNFIPEDGFVLAVNLGNDYGSVNYTNKIADGTFHDLPNVNVGDTAYVSGMDLAAGTIEKSSGNHWDKTFTSNAKIYIGSKPDGVTLYEPDRSSPRLSQTALSFEEGDVINCEKDFTFSWAEVENAESYLVNVNDCTAVGMGATIVSNAKTTETSFTVKSSRLTVGCSYIVSVSACAVGYRSSFNEMKSVFAVSEKAMSSKFADKKIVAFGDSITALTGWVKMLGGELGCNVINAGVSGNTTNDAVKRIDTDVIALKPDIVIVMFGMNDQAVDLTTKKSIVSLSVYEKNYRTIIDKLRSAGCDVILMTGHEVCTSNSYYTAGQYNLDYGTGAIDEYYATVRSLAAEYGINLIDLNELLSEEKSTQICAVGDGIHLSVYGHGKYSKLISDFMYNSYVEKLGFEESQEESSDEPSSEEESLQEQSPEASKTDDVSNDVSVDEQHAKLESTVIIVVSVVLVIVLTLLAFLPSRLRKKKK